MLSPDEIKQIILRALMAQPSLLKISVVDLDEAAADIINHLDDIGLAIYAKLTSET